MLADGSLDGRLVVIDGEMRLDGRACGAPHRLRHPDHQGLDEVQIDTDTEARVALQHAIPPPGPARVRGPRRRPSLPRAAAGGRRPSHHRQPAPRHADPVPGRPVVPGPRADRRPAAGVGLARHRRTRFLSTRTPTSGFWIGPSPG